MSITKLKTLGQWGPQWGPSMNDLTRVGTHLGGRRVITGMLTGPAAPLDLPDPPPAVVARIPGTRPPTRR